MTQSQPEKLQETLSLNKLKKCKQTTQKPQSEIKWAHLCRSQVNLLYFRGEDFRSTQQSGSDQNLT